MAKAKAGWAAVALTAFLCSAAAQVPQARPSTDERPRRAVPDERPAEDQEPEPDAGAIRLNADLVLVTAVVVKDSNEKKPIRDLTARDFALLDEGVRQEIAFFGDEELPLDIEFLFDASESTHFKQKFQREVLGQFLLGLLRPKDSAAVLWFSDHVHVEQDNTSKVDALLAAVERIPPGGATVLYNAIAVSGDRLRKRAGRRAMVILSDGHDTFSETRLDVALRRAQDADAVIYAINTARPAWAVSEEFRANDALEFLAEETGGEVFYPGDVEDVTEVLELLTMRLRERYTLGFYPSANASNGKFRNISLTVNREGTRVLARKGYYAPSR